MPDALTRHHISRNRAVRARCSPLLVASALGCLRAGDVEVLHGEAPDAAWFLKTWDDAAPARARGQERPRALGVADGGRESDAPRVDPRHTREALDKAQRLSAAVATQERVDFVDNHKTQIAKEPRHRSVFVHEQCLERFGRDLENAARFFKELALVRGGNVAMPVPDGDVRLLAQVVKAQELVVDERLERADVERAHAGRRVLVKEGEDGEERRLGFARGGRGREKDVLVGVKDRLGGSNLNGAQVLPRMVVDKVLHKRCKAVKDAHEPSSQANMCFTIARLL